MRFPGKRKTKHYFPVEERSARDELESDIGSSENIYIVGMDQLLVDIEINVDDSFLNHHNFQKGQSFIIETALADTIYAQFKAQGKISGEFPGGAIGNTLHNFSVLADCPSVALGTINKNITVGDYAYKYLCKTNANVDLSYLLPCQQPMGRALCFVTPDGERTFAISKGCMDDLTVESLPEKVIRNASALLVSAYCLRNENTAMFKATVAACQMARESNVPIVMSLGTSSLVKERKNFLNDFIRKYVNILAMNQQEAFELIGTDDPLLCCQEMLEVVDLVLVTVGKRGLYLAGLTEQEAARQTKEPLHTKSIVEYNKFEYSRAMERKYCTNPIKIYTHINPFMGGPMVIKNTNGAGDAALAAVLHDIVANVFHREKIPNSPKHKLQYLTYSSLSQISKYANRVSFEVLVQNSPRLARGLPQKEDSLEESYWEK
jgi:inosine kinase